MKVIDLLNKIANGEELPNEIKCGGIIYKRYEYNNKYYKKDDINREKDILSEHLANESFYNSGIEIIEEDKEIEELKCLEIKKISEMYCLSSKNISEEEKWEKTRKLIYEYRIDLENLKYCINELIEAVNELKKGK